MRANAQMDLPFARFAVRGGRGRELAILYLLALRPMAQRGVLSSVSAAPISTQPESRRDSLATAELNGWLDAACAAAEDMARGLGLCCLINRTVDANWTSDDLSPAAYVPLIGEDFLLQLGIVVQQPTCAAFVAACMGGAKRIDEVELADIADVIGEVANTLAGEIHAQLLREGTLATVGLPFFVRGRAWVPAVGEERSAVIHFGPSRVCLVLMRSRSQEFAGRKDTRDKTRLLEMAIESRKAAEAFNRDLIANAPYAIVSTDARGQIIAWNPTAEHMLGLRAHEALGHKITEFFSVPVGDTKDPLAALALQNPAEHGLGRSFEFLGKHVDGRFVPVELQMIATQREARATFTAFVKDLTELKRAEREVRSLNSEILTVSRRAGMAEVAGEVLHNVGNVLNSVFVSTRVMREQLATSRITVLTRLAALVEEKGDELPAFLAKDPRGRQVVPLIRELGRQLAEEHRRVVGEVDALSGHVEHIAAVIGAQRRHVGTSGVYEVVPVREVIESAIEVLSHRIRSHGIEIVRSFDEIAPFAIDKHKLLQILINMIKNAVESVIDAKQERPQVCIELRTHDEKSSHIVVSDNGVGIGAENMRKIFSHGFTTKSYGTGFGLHASANAAKELGGNLSCESEGLGRGARFTLELPCTAEEGRMTKGFRIV